MSLSEINVRERNFHNQLHLSGGEDRLQQNKFYKALYSLQIDFLDSLKRKTKSKDVLDYGCGTGSFTEKVIAFQPKKIVAIDISEEAIKKAKNKPEAENKNVEYRVENCENLNLNSDTFDVAYGGGILHHLNLNKSLNELNRVLRKDGTIIFVEPLATNPLINLYRKFTPKARSKDEHPLINEDFLLIQKKYKNVKIKYYGFMTLFFFPFYRNPEKSYFFNALKNIDQFLFRFKIFRLMAWSVLITAKKS
mgnify:CR=1 FL=1